MTPAWWYISNNFGDNLNHYLIGAIGKKPVIYTERNRPHNIICGSILHECNEWSTVWGAGFGNAGQRINTKYANIQMVRGELSRDILGIDCMTGDPALMLPMYHNPKIICANKTPAIIPHYTQYEYMLKEYPDIRIIDPFLPVDKFIQEVCCSSSIVSSSLHGLIVADAYNIPNSWFGYGDEFKYRDYYTTTKEPKEPISEVNFDNCFVSEYKHNLVDMLACCPFV